MWNTIASSKLAQCSEFKRSYQIHKQKLQMMKPMLKIKEPRQPMFIFTKPKLQMSRRDRLKQIDKHNCILLNKLDHIYDSTQPENKRQGHNTLNHHFNSIIKERIEEENQRFCKKLLRTNSHYQTNRIVHQTDKLGKICISLSQNARRVKSLSRTSKTRPDSAFSYKFVRSKSQKENLFEDIRTENTSAEKKGRSWVRPGSAPSVKVSKAHLQKKTVLEDIKVNEGEEEEEIIV